jgi:hypothetical protein
VKYLVMVFLLLIPAQSTVQTDPCRNDCEDEYAQCYAACKGDMNCQDSCKDSYHHCLELCSDENLKCSGRRSKTQ